MLTFGDALCSALGQNVDESQQHMAARMVRGRRQGFGQFRFGRREGRYGIGTFVVKAVDVFTPNDVPTFSYVERGEYNFERRLEDALSVPKMIISLSGPSKSGKTVLVRRVVGENLIHVYGATIKTSDDLWSKVLDWMDAPEQVVEKEGSTNSIEGWTSGGGAVGIPFVAQGKGEVGIKSGDSTLTIVVAQAQGFSDTADKPSALVIRNTDQGRVATKVDAGAILAGSAPDPRVYGGDTIVVDDSFARVAGKDVLIILTGASAVRLLFP
jgi:hypothetical protein